MRKESANPFYIALAIIGGVFAITACAYFMMALRALQPANEGGVAEPGIIMFLRHYGTHLLVGELVLLAIATFGAIALDDIRQRRAAKHSAMAESPTISDKKSDIGLHPSDDST